MVVSVFVSIMITVVIGKNTIITLTALDDTDVCVRCEVSCVQARPFNLNPKP